MKKTPSVMTSLWPGSAHEVLEKRLTGATPFVVKDFDGGSGRGCAVDDAGVV